MLIRANTVPQNRVFIKQDSIKHMLEISANINEISLEPPSRSNTGIKQDKTPKSSNDLYDDLENHKAITQFGISSRKKAEN